MARQRGGAKRGGGGGMFAKKPAPKKPAAPTAPARQAPPPAAAAPAPAPAAAAPAAAPAAGGGMMSGLGGMVMQGMAMGTGSAIAHQAINSMMGGGSSSAPAEAAAPVAAAAPAPAAAPYSAAPAADGAACSSNKTELFKCLGDNNNDANACQYYFDALRNCQENAQFAT